ncbi:MAG TPA: hypothetical protein VM686_07430 [Polyangiaceae bacterium]|nr:hypothetical protein [Polyangiaceae bacterium]
MATAVLGAAVPASAQEAISEEAKIYFANGVELLQDQPPNYTDAYYQFKLAYEKSNSWKVLGNLGLCSMKLERDGEAIEYYTKYLAQGGNDIDQEERQALQRELMLMTGNVVEVTITTPLPDLEVTDSRVGSSAPTQSYRITNGSTVLKLRAGTHVMTATSNGKTQRWEAVLAPGRPQSHAFDFSEGQAAPAAAPASQPGPAAPSTDTGETKQSGGMLRTIGFVTAGVGVLALGGGVVTGLMTNGKENDARDQCRDAPGGMECPASVEADFDSAKSLAGVTNVLLIGGGVLTAAGVGMIIFGGPTAEKPQPAARLKLTPILSPQASGLFASGTF